MTKLLSFKDIFKYMNMPPIFTYPKEKELSIVNNNRSTTDDKNQFVSYKDIVCIKPWGYEFLVYQNNCIAIWFLKITAGNATSLHTHFKKNTLLYCISGSAKIILIDNEVHSLSPLQSIFIPKNKFHSLASFSPDVFLLEIELFQSDVSFSDKNDLLRIDDQYNRKKTGYESSIEIVRNNLDKYQYFYLSDNFKRLINGITFTVSKINSNNYMELYNHKESILLSGEIETNGLRLKEGSILTNISKNIYCDRDALVLSLNNIDTQEDYKIIYSMDHLKHTINKLHDKKVVLTSGCFDILHVGHLHNLKVAKSLGDILIVCLSNDEQVKKLKGLTRPVNCYEDRINLFKTISYVDFIVLYSESNIATEETLGSIMKIVDPYYWVKGSDYQKDKILDKHPYLRNIYLIENIEEKSTTNIINKIKPKE